MSRTLTGFALAAALTASLLMPGVANAIPASQFAGIGATPTTNVQTVDYRGRGGYYRGGHRGYGRGVGLGIGAAIIGGALIAGASRSRDYDYYDGDVESYSGGGSGVSRCAATFKSFDSDTGTYMGYDGERHTCPYLR